jgi:hypothetical protein
MHPRIIACLLLLVALLVASFGGTGVSAQATGCANLPKPKSATGSCAIRGADKVCTFKCQNQGRHAGDLVRKCLSSGQYAGTPLICPAAAAPMVCDDLESPPGAAPASCPGSDGFLCTFVCAKPQVHLAGDNQRSCDGNMGGWTGARLMCGKQEIEDLTLAIIIAGAIVCILFVCGCCIGMFMNRDSQIENAEMRVFMNHKMTFGDTGMDYQSNPAFM